jgi:hypothetical protein
VPKYSGENIFKLRIGTENLHEIRNDNGIRVVNFVTSKNPTIKNTMFPHHNISSTNSSVFSVFISHTEKPADKIPSDGCPSGYFPRDDCVKWRKNC